MIKGLTWGLVVFSSLAVLGMLSQPATDSTFWGLLYAGLVIAQGILVIKHLKEEGK